jgi:beta-phosphoglucomutase-like phosphatase (HAD superfamily)
VEFRAVLFDIDGTLVDSNHAHAQAWARAFAAMGVTSIQMCVNHCLSMQGVERPGPQQRTAIYNAPWD